SDPWAWARLLRRKALLTVNWYEVPDAEDMYFFTQGSGLLRLLDRMWNLGVLLPAAVVGAVLTSGRRRGAWALVATAVTLAGGVAMFYVFARYRYPFVPVLALFAGAALPAAAEAVRARRWRRLVASAVACAVVAVPANRVIYTRDYQLAA